MRVAVSLLILALLVWQWRRFLLLTPVAPYAGYMFMRPERSPDFNFVIGYAELLVLLVFAARELTRANGWNEDLASLTLVGYPLLAIPSLFFAHGNLLQAVFLMMLLMLSGFLFRWLRRHSAELEEARTFEKIVLVWIVFGIATKLMEGVRFHPPEQAWWEYALLSRSGGMGGSNHAAGIIFIFLPFVTSSILLLASVAFLALCYSRGVVATLLFYLTLRLFTGRRVVRQPWIRLALVAVVIGAIIFLALPSATDVFVKEATNRLVGSDTLGRTVAERLSNRYTFKESRAAIFQDALDVAAKTSYFGIGAGGFAWGLRDLLGRTGDDVFSNSHNVYLTLLSEMGLPFLLAFVGICAYFAARAFSVRREAFFSLMLFLVYGVFSGEIYEASGLASATDYYYLIAVFACAAAATGRPDAHPARRRVEAPVRSERTVSVSERDNTRSGALT